MKDFLKKWLPGNKKEVVVAAVPEKKVDVPPANLPLALEDLFFAGREVEKLQKDRQKVLEKHRTAVQDLEDFKVAKKSKEGKRSKTYNDYLGHIETEIEEIANKLGQARENFDLPQSRPEILRERLVRLDDLKKIAEEKFTETELGKEYSQYLENLRSIDKKVAEAHPRIGYGVEADQEIKRLNNERIDLEKDFEYKIKRKKEFMDYARTVDKADRLISDTEVNLHDVLDDDYDENGFNRIK